MMKKFIIVAAMAGVLATQAATAQTKLTLRVDKAERTVSPTLYGLMTEEINYSYEGGLYSQLLRDPTMQELTGGQNRRGFAPGAPAPKPKYWELSDSTAGKVNINNTGGINFTLKKFLSVELAQPTSVVNPGFWGIGLHPATTYFGDAYLKGQGKVTVGLRSLDGSKVYASQDLNLNSNEWKQYSYTFQMAADVKPTKDVQFFLQFHQAGNYGLSYPTLFPKAKKAYSIKSDWFRTDIMDLLREMHPKFLRFPGGNYLEGNTFKERFDWKRTLGSLSTRPGHRSPWNYWSTDGMGLLEFLCWAEECGAEPILGVFAGYVLNGDYVEGDALEPFIQDALDEIEYVMGSPTSKWGAVRAREGHPEPFKLTYVEIGNEDFFDRSGSYSHRFMQFYDAIKAKYPQLQIISTQEERMLRGNAEDPAAIKVDVIDEHYYRNAEAMYRAAQQYDSYDRKGPKIFCGEWATREGDPTTNMNAALGDAAWMTCMERNSDILVAHCYAPLFVNVNEGGMQWKSDLIGYDALTSFGSPSYHAQCMFAQNLGNKVVPMEAEGVPTVPMGREPVPQLYYNTTVDTQTGKLYLKLVNIGASSQTVTVEIQGAKVKGKAVVTTLKPAKPEDTNSIDNPNNITPSKSSLRVSNNFKITLAPYSISVVAM